MTADEKRLEHIQRVVDEQALDESLWFEARTAPEAYLQKALRRLHAAVELPWPNPQIDSKPCG